LWFPSFILVVSLVYDTPAVAQPKALASTTVATTTTVSPAPPAPATVPTTTSELTSGSLCSEPGIRYAGTTTHGAKVCFTLTRDRSEWVEISYTFFREGGCTDTVERRVSVGYGVPLDGPGRIDLLVGAENFTATIDGATATGYFENPGLCGTRRFQWHARRVPR
jgi:hypothetical protein